MIRLIRQRGRVSAKRLSATAVAVLMALEAFRSFPYKDIAGVWTNGFGNTEGVTAKTPPVTQEQAKATLLRHADKFGDAVSEALTIEPTQGQYDSYVLVAYNIGPEAFASSSTVKAHNRGDFYGACMYELRWNKVTIKGQKVISRGLMNRRFTEYNLCVAGIPNVGYVPRRK